MSEILEKPKPPERIVRDENGEYRKLSQGEYAQAVLAYRRAEQDYRVAKTTAEIVGWLMSHGLSQDAADRIYATRFADAVQLGSITASEAIQMLHEERFGPHPKPLTGRELARRALRGSAFNSTPTNVDPMQVDFTK